MVFEVSPLQLQKCMKIKNYGYYACNIITAGTQPYHAIHQQGGKFPVTWNTVRPITISFKISGITTRILMSVPICYG